jgi:hypothetical protein
VAFETLSSKVVTFKIIIKFNTKGVGEWGTRVGHGPPERDPLQSKGTGEYPVCGLDLSTEI